MKKKKKLSHKVSQIDKHSKKRKPEFFLELFERKFVKTKIGRRTKFIKQDLKKFNNKKFYQIYVVHRPSRSRKLLGIGKFNKLPVRSTGYFPKVVNGKIIRMLSPREIRKRKHEITRKFRIGKIAKARGKWIPIRKVYGSFQRELEERAKTLNAKTRGIIFPLMNFFHTEWMVFSDTQIKNGNLLIKRVYVSLIMDFDYPRQHFISKRHVRFDFPRKIKVKNLHKYQDKMLAVLQDELEAKGVSSNVTITDINGFIILE